MLFNENIETWNELTTLLQNYFEENTKKDTPVVEYASASKLKGLINLSLDKSGASTQELLEEVKNYLKYSVRTTHPQFNNQLQAGANFESLLGEIV